MALETIMTPKLSAMITVNPKRKRKKESVKSELSFFFQLFILYIIPYYQGAGVAESAYLTGAVLVLAPVIMAPESLSIPHQSPSVGVLSGSLSEVNITGSASVPLTLNVPPDCTVIPLLPPVCIAVVPLRVTPGPISNIWLLRITKLEKE